MLLKLAKGQDIEILPNQKQRRGESLLDFRRRLYKIPPITHQPIDDNVIVWRLPPISLSKGGIVMPEDQQSPNFKGVLLAMGPRARDHLIGNGIEEGHVVIFGRFAGWEHKDDAQTFQRSLEIIELKSKDINGSEDVLVALQKGELKYIKGADGRHQLAKVTRTERLLGPVDARKAKALALANGTDNEHERESALRVANGKKG